MRSKQIIYRRRIDNYSIAEEDFEDLRVLDTAGSEYGIGFFRNGAKLH